MSDADWRALEREWRAAPGDQALLARLVAARRRAGAGVAVDLLEARVVPACTFDSRLALNVAAELAPGDVVHVGQTPGEVVVPEHLLWWVQPIAERAPRREPARPRGAGAGAAPPHGARYPPTERVLGEVRRRLVPGVVVADPDLDDPALADALAAVEHLELLAFADCARVSDEGLAAVAALSRLARLDVAGCGYVTDATLERLPALAELTTLQLHGAGVTDAGLSRLADVPHLADLDLSRCRGVTDAGVERCAALASLRSLDLWGCPIDDGALASLGRAERLARLNLRWCQRVTDAGLAHVAGLPRLARLYLSRTGVRALAGLERAASLVELDLTGCALTEDAPGRLAGLPRLRRLDLRACPVDDAWLPRLAQAPALAELDLRECPHVTADGAAALESARGLERLQLDRGLDRSRLPERVRGALGT